MTDTLTVRDAYAAMFAFLEGLYRRTKSDDLGTLLGGMSLLEDGGTADLAYWAEWKTAIRKEKTQKINLALDLRDGA